MGSDSPPGSRRSTSPTEPTDLFVAKNCTNNDIDETKAELVDWASLEILQGHGYDKRDVPVEENEMFALLDLTDEEKDQEEEDEVNLKIIEGPSQSIVVSKSPAKAAKERAKKISSRKKKK
ncbi:hypothetical protein ABZP36_004329 [Zizania latifolia]